MTKKQERRMKIFALRMVNVVSTPRWRPAVRELVSDCLDRFRWNDSFKVFLDWDNSTDRPDPNSHSGKQTSELLCDEVTRFIWDMEEEGRLPSRSNFGDPNKESALSNHLMCCIRAAADVAVAPSAGVLGFTVGDLREMWKDKNLPPWVTDFFEADITQQPDEHPVWL